MDSLFHLCKVYEGGYKVWECTLDLLRLFNTKKDLVHATNLLDLGCGVGLAGLCAMLNGAAEVHFHDYVSTSLYNTRYTELPIYLIC